MAAPQRKIFISYRRQDNPEFVQRIRDQFAAKYGRANVFIDFDTIPPMVKFADYIRKSIEECDAMLVIIGAHWLEILQQRLKSDAEDFVRVEVGLGLKFNKPLAPICIDDAHMPGAADLPDDLRGLLDYNAAFLRTGRDFFDNMDNILAAVETQLAKSDPNTKAPDPSSWQPDPAKWEPPTPAPASQMWASQQPLFNPLDYYNRAFQKEQSGDHDGAIEDFSNAIGLSPIYADAYNSRGWAYFQKGDPDRAIQDYNIAILQFGQNPLYYMNRALALASKRMYDAAVQDYNRVLMFNPQNANGYLYRGTALMEKGDFNNALVDLNRAIMLNPLNPVAFLNRGNAFIRTQQFQAAAQNYAQAAQLNPQYADAYWGLGDSAYAMGQYPAALGYYRQYVALAGIMANPSILERVGMLESGRR